MFKTFLDDNKQNLKNVIKLLIESCQTLYNLAILPYNNRVMDDSL